MRQNIWRLVRCFTCLAIVGVVSGHLNLHAAKAAEAATAAAGNATSSVNATFSPQTVPPLPSQLPVQRSEKTPTPVQVILDGTDGLGSRLTFQLKDVVNKSSLFTLTEKDTPKIQILITTEPDLAGRPEAGSVYVAIWVYYERSSSFLSYLDKEIGVVTASNVDDIVSRMAERTTSLASTYSYIFEGH